jgi:hypothetical protein
MKVAIYNDCDDPPHRHFGTQMVMETYAEQLDRVNIEYVGSVKYLHLRDDAVLRKADLVIVNGEGSFHHNRRNDLAEIATRFPCVLLNTVFQDNDVDLSSFRYIAARETLSAAQVNGTGAMCDVVPDIILTSNRLRTFQKSRGAGIANVRHVDDGGFYNVVSLQDAQSFLVNINRYASMDTESFHGVIVAAALGMPFHAWGGNTHKIKSVVADIEADPDGVRGWVIKGKMKINAMFERLHTFC